jgi:hypothetical protein
MSTFAFFLSILAFVPRKNFGRHVAKDMSENNKSLMLFNKSVIVGFL